MKRNEKIVIIPERLIKERMGEIKILNKSTIQRGWFGTNLGRKRTAAKLIYSVSFVGGPYCCIKNKETNFMEIGVPSTGTRSAFNIRIPGSTI